MKRAAIGIQMHSGWGVLVAVAGEARSLEIVDRRRIVTADPEISGSNQPYHYAARLEFPESEKYIAGCTAGSTRLALSAMQALLAELNERRCQVVGCVVLLASGRALPLLAKVLTSHPLIHRAEGEFFRRTAFHACEGLQVSVAAIRERELEERAKAAFGKSASRVQQQIAGQGGSIGPPWTRDHKTAALAASLMLAPGGLNGWTGPAKGELAHAATSQL
jgi:hypothetical protein